METCSAKRGFFSLRDCDGMVAAQCAACGRPMCSHHLSPDSGFTRCLDCEARNAEKLALTGGPPLVVEQPLADPAWPYRYRSRYYRSSNYSPWYFGSNLDPYYNDYDLRSFDSDVASRGPIAAAADVEPAGFGDS
jgi:hypothetical protein